ncbi:MAG: TIR domain-containing protein [Saprospiraceae bacterium]|nr:TIR domain-containing protein [Saprospiraceae bacterium]
MAAEPLKVFIIYAREDELFRAELKAQLLPMERAGLLRVWTDRELIAGEHWEPAIKQNLNSADIILLLVSSDYFQSDYIHDVEIKEALRRHDMGEARVIPVIVRPCDWEPDSTLSRLQVLPTDGVPVNDTRHWHSREAAWVDVVRGVRRTLQQMQADRAIVLQEKEASERKRIEQERLAREAAEKQRRMEEEQRQAEVLRLRDEEARRQRDEQNRQASEARKQAYRASEYLRQQAERDQRKPEEDSWQKALQTGTEDAYHAYLSAYPNGAYAKYAQRVIKQLRRTAAANKPLPWRRVAMLGGSLALVFALAVYFWPSGQLDAEPTSLPVGEIGTPKQPQDAGWVSASKANTIVAYRQFLQQNPGSPFASDARNRLVQFYLNDAYQVLRDSYPTECKNLLQEALKIEPEHATAKKAYQLLQEGKTKQAEQTLAFRQSN